MTIAWRARARTFLHGTISNRPHHVAVPETPVYLDALLVDTPLTGGLEPRLYARTSVIIDADRGAGFKAYLWSDNVSEFIATAVQKWLGHP